MEIISAFCELHPQLRVANLYIKISPTCRISNIASINNNSIHLDGTDDSERSVAVLKFPASVKLLDNLKFKTDSIDEVYVHLRMPIGVPAGSLSGSENTEVLDLSTLNIHTAQTSVRKVFIPKEDTDYRVRCAECQSNFIDSARFKRVLPLPRASWSDAASDWYCHSHGGEEKLELVPRSTDCLYGSSYHSFAVSLLVEGSVDSREKEALCSLCQSSVGVIRGDHWNPWCHSVQWQVLEDGKWKSNAEEEQPTSLQAFYLVLNDAFEEEKSFIGRKLGFRSCLAGNRILILWFVGDNSTNLESTRLSDTEIEMRPSVLHKVLYKISSSSTDKMANDVSEYEVSEQMMASIIHVLNNSTEHLPPRHRLAAGFSIGFIPIKLSSVSG